MTKKIIDLYGKKKVYGSYGIEIELEGERAAPFIYDGGWETVRELSLRNQGVEYVSVPFFLGNADKKLDFLFDRVKECRPKVDCPRTSTHVHRNVGSYTPTQVWNIAAAYWLFENILMKFCGPDRIGNNFCLRLCDAEDVLFTCIKDITGELTPFSSFGVDEYKYAALNLATVSTLNTLEFRGMRGLTNTKDVLQWLTILDTMIKQALTYDNPEILLDDYYHTNNKRSFIEKFFKDNTDVLLYPGWKKTLATSAGDISILCYCEDWKKLETREYTKEYRDDF